MSGWKWAHMCSNCIERSGIVLGQFDELLQIVSAIIDARVHGRGDCHPGGLCQFHVRFLRYERSLGKQCEKKSISDGSSTAPGDCNSPAAPVASWHDPFGSI